MIAYLYYSYMSSFSNELLITWILVITLLIYFRLTLRE
ncbi:hypothetical protein A1OE_866 [Candidatus Endolissoclinum faulkneri L2]|uniref:Uncharacterized protein n=1 Tax=Candidatus Endolissoclinum faulkneri L2 TaxID=1193729 RepID=K7YHK3_9PROT|nr:hypothetical protein A1OE_866 [Candidatus Endolissoclinum faulkneri L2]